jgi:hypothetical protein
MPGAQGGEAVRAGGCVHGPESFTAGSLNASQQNCEVL